MSTSTRTSSDAEFTAFSPALVGKFWARVDKSGSCWEWTGTREVDGYGTIYVTRRRTVKAHRFSWELANGPITDGLGVLHRCDNPPCVNPAHLFLGTNADNVADMEGKGRGRHPRGEALGAAAGERSGQAKFTWDQVRSIRAEHKAGGISIGALARRYGVSQPTMSLLIRGKTWTHEPGEPWKPSNTTVARRRATKETGK